MKTHRRWLATGLMAGAALLITACGSSSPGSSGPAAGGGSGAAGNTITTASTSVGTVLTDSQGHAIYWFVPDSPTKSACNGSCATFWPPVKGPVAAAAGVSLPHQLGTITRADGTTQATYDGHPLYTYSGDGGPGQVTGNNLNASGGLWFAMTPSGAKPGAKSGPSTSPSAAGGYGY